MNNLSIAAGFVLLRCLSGGIVAAHGLKKIQDPTKTASEFLRDGLGGGRIGALIGSLTQIVGGTLMIVGLATPLASAMLVGVMLVATTVKIPKGFWNLKGGYEYPATLLCLAAALGMTGPGTWSVDHWVGLKFPQWSGVIAVLFGVVVAMLVRGWLRVLAGRASQ